MRFASKFVEDGVLSRIYEARRADFLTFIFTSSVGAPAVAGVRGPMFEHFAHHRLPRGGTFRVRPLIAGGAVENWVIPALAHYSVADLAHLSLQHLRYAQPKGSNFAALDSFADYDPAFLVGFQMTVSPSHPVKARRLEAVLAQLGFTTKPQANARKLRIVFVVPPDIFGDFTAPQNYLCAKKQALQNVPAIISKNCEQFVLELPMS